MKTNKPLTLDFQGITLHVPEGAEVILVKDATYCAERNKRVDAYALKNPNEYGACDSVSRHYYAWVPDNAVKDIPADAVLVQAARKAKSDDWYETSDKWLVDINGQKFDYYTGIGLRVASMAYGARDRFKALNGKNLNEHGFAEFMQYSKAVPPKLDDVLYSLVMDASACDESFEDWCANLGYDTDSRKALETYLACQENASKLRKAGYTIEAERERLADY